MIYIKFLISVSFFEALWSYKQICIFFKQISFSLTSKRNHKLNTLIEETNDIIKYLITLISVSNCNNILRTSSKCSVNSLTVAGDIIKTAIVRTTALPRQQRTRRAFDAGTGAIDPATPTEAGPTLPIQFAAGAPMLNAARCVAENCSFPAGNISPYGRPIKLGWVVNIRKGRAEVSGIIYINCCFFIYLF